MLGEASVSLEIDIKETAKALLVAAGLATSVAQADIQSASANLARQYGKANSEQIEAEIARYIRNPPRD